jgi:hypothetical protein
MWIESIPVQWLSLAILVTNIAQWITMIIVYRLTKRRRR